MHDLDSAANATKNREFYEHAYSQVDVDRLVAKLRDSRAFLSRARETGSFWGFYADGFEHLLAGKRIVELGSGNGLNALLMASFGAEVLAIDISEHCEHSTLQAADKLGLKNVTARTGDFVAMELEPASFDFVVGKHILHHLTHDIEAAFLEKTRAILKPAGIARFVEPAVNNHALDNLRWLVPVPGRPSILARRAFAAWKARDPHPVRDNSSAHYTEAGRRYFHEVKIRPFGSIDRLHRFLPRGGLNNSYRRWAHRIEPGLPDWFRSFAARAQIIDFARPRH